ncbi:MAG: ACT domain-containing protein, partial [Pirellulaceae bacterium]|nr:ACT domain-containing protein [Pirellulaceae bacterium]
AFELHQAPQQREPAPARAGGAVARPRSADAADIADHLRGIAMEELVINGISLDQQQARVTISGVPDTPGVAARVFEEVAAAGILVDMIVQSYNGVEGLATLSFTVPRDKLDTSLRVAEQLAREFRCQEVSSSPRIAKLSVSGIGLRSHTSVGIRMFRALAEAGINVAMINTSEVHVNVVVDGPEGQRALERLQAAFADVLV